jgi:hypothetical protein
MATVITDLNIRGLVLLYYDFHYRNQENRLPEDLRDVSMNDWDVSNVTDMSDLFSSVIATNEHAPITFNEPLDRWNVSNVKQMGGMFADCVEFNQPIRNWDIKNVVSMAGMFAGCRKFNQPLNNWRINQNVVNIDRMFYNAESFHRNLHNWCVRISTYQEGGMGMIFHNSPMMKYVNIIADPRSVLPATVMGRQRERIIADAEKMLPDVCRQTRPQPAPSVRRVVEPPKCMTEAKFNECSKNDEGVVEDPINYAVLTRQTAVRPPGDSKQCFDRAELRKWVEANEARYKVPTNPVTREVLPDDWIMSNLKRGDNCVDEVVPSTVPSTSGGRRTRKAQRRRSRTKVNRRSKKARGGSKKAKRSRSRKHMTRRRKH